MPTLAYVGHTGAVSVINTNTNTVVNSIPVSFSYDYAMIIAITPDGKFAYVTNLLGPVSVIDTCTNKVVATVAVGLYPVGIAISPDGKFAYVANNGSNNVSVIDTGTNTVAATIPVGSGPIGIATTPDGNFVYITISLQDRVSVIDTASNTVVDTIAVGDYPYGIAITPDGSFVYVANHGQSALANSVSVIDTSTNTVVDTITVGLGPTLIAITPDGNFAYVTNAGSDTVSVIDTAANIVVRAVSVGEIPFGIAATPNGDFVYVTNAYVNTVSVIDTGTNTVVDTIPDGFGPLGIAIANIECAAAPETICIETTRIFDSCMFEDEAQKTFEFPNSNKHTDIQCKILKTKYSILDITRIDEAQNLVNVKLAIKVLLGFTGNFIDDNTVNRVVSFERNITLTAPDDADITCDISNVACVSNHTSSAVSSSCNYMLDCTVKVTALVQSKKLVQIQIPFLGECTPRQCCTGAGMPMSPGTSYPLPSQASQINKIKFTAKTNPGTTSRIIALFNGLPLAFATVTGEQKAFELNLTGAPYPVGNVRLINAGKSTIYICNLTTE